MMLKLIGADRQAPSQKEKGAVSRKIIEAKHRLERCFGEGKGFKEKAKMVKSRKRPRGVDGSFETNVLEQNQSFVTQKLIGR